jgi:epoxide hydrolase 4
MRTPTLIKLSPLALGLALTAGCSGEKRQPVSDDTAATSDACPVDAPELREVTLSGVRLDYACQGEGVEGEPTILMLHGFPEFWMAWAPVMDLLAPNHRVIAPDQRGYNTSDKPESLDDYALDVLVADIDEFIDHIGGPVILVGHDWGGGVAWAVASDHPEQVEKLVIMNAPHMNVFRDELQNNPEQTAAFSYVDLFVQPGTETLLVANDFSILNSMFEGVLTEDELVDYQAAWGQERAIEGGLNWYRANFTDSLPNTERELVVDVPTLVMWGMDDTALLPSNLEGLPAYVADLEVQEVEGATHWIAHEKPAVVADGIAAFIE